MLAGSTLEDGGISRVFPRADAFSGEVYANVAADPDNIDCETVDAPPDLTSVGAELPPERFVRYDFVESAPGE